MPRCRLARPTVAALGALALLLAACGGLGADELPEEIGADARDEITEALSAFFGGVDSYNPQVASELMLIPAELGIPEVERMVWEIGALQSEELQFDFQSLGPTRVVVDGEGEPLFVSAAAVTAFGSREFELVRRDGRWLLSAVPDLSVPQDAGPVALTTEVHRQDLTAGGAQINVGEIVNLGSENAQIFGIAAIARDADGRTIATSRGTVATVILRPGEASPFRVAVGGSDRGVIAQTTFVVTAKRVADSDFELFAAVTLSVSGIERARTAEGGSVVRGTVRNDGFERAIPFPAAVAYDADDRLLAVGGGGDLETPLQPGAAIAVEVPLPDLRLLGLEDQVAEVRLLVMGFEVGSSVDLSPAALVSVHVRFSRTVVVRTWRKGLQGRRADGTLLERWYRRSAVSGPRRETGLARDRDVRREGTSSSREESGNSV